MKNLFQKELTTSLFVGAKIKCFLNYSYKKIIFNIFLSKTKVFLAFVLVFYHVFPVFTKSLSKIALVQSIQKGL